MITDKIQKIMADAGIIINGPNPWDILVKDNRCYARIWHEKNLGLGESYMEGWWSCSRIDEMICRILRLRLEEKVKGNLRYLIHLLPQIVYNLQSVSNSHVVAQRHYDLDNDLFLSFLDPYNQYSCAYFKNTDDLAQAQENKLKLICEKTAISPDDHVLDVGCGWGGFARYAAENYGCRITAVNVSKEQLHYARNFCKNFSVDFLDCDYREVQGRFDKIISVGMFEHVGLKNYRTFMEVIHRILSRDGIFLLHTIGNNESHMTCDPWITKYIFPNSMLPSLAQISSAAEGLFVLEDLHNLCPHYDKTLMAWHQNFQSAWPSLEHKYDQVFKRMWDYYLLSCAGAFRARGMQVWQIIFTKTGKPQPSCRCT